MQNAAPLNTGTMAAIIGLDKDLVEECRRRVSKLGWWNRPPQLLLPDRRFRGNKGGGRRG